MPSEIGIFIVCDAEVCILMQFMMPGTERTSRCLINELKFHLFIAFPKLPLVAIFYRDHI